MQPRNQSTTCGYHSNPWVISVPPTHGNSLNGNLWGSSVRSAMGIIQIVCGIIEVVLGITLISMPVRNYTFANVGWGIWNGVFAIITGFHGVYSQRSKCMVIAYMVLSIIAAAMSFTCCAATSAVSPTVYTLRWGDPYYDSDEEYLFGYRYRFAKAHFGIYITLAVVYGLQMLTSIIGASFTCGALISRNNQHQIVYQQTAQPFQPAPPYTAIANQPPPYNGYLKPFSHGPETFLTGPSAI